MTTFRVVGRFLLKWWHLVFLAIVVVVVLITARYVPVIGGTILSIANGESSVGFWIHKMGLSFLAAEAVAMGVSTAENILWFVIFSATKNFFTHKIKPLYDKVTRRINPTKFNGESEWVRPIYAFVSNILAFLVPPMPEEGVIPGDPKLAFRFYCRIAAYGFTPTYIWTGVGYSVALASRGFVNIVVAALIVIIANCGKMFVCGYVSQWLNWWMPIVAFCIVPAIILQIVRQIQKRSAKKKEHDTATPSIVV